MTKATFITNKPKVFHPEYPTVSTTVDIDIIAIKMHSNNNYLSQK